MGIFPDHRFYPLLENKTHINRLKLLLFLVFATISDEAAPGALHDYCENDYFEAECPPGKIVIIEEARYGRMELGTCILADFGYLNCYSDILAVLDQRCSGRYACRVKVSDFLDYRSSCTTELASYLQARYTCESVMMPDEYCCQTPGERVTLTANRGLISNLATQSSGCGGIDCPWLLEASVGQMFNISLLDFNTYNMGESGYENQDRRCDIYAKINEDATGATVTVCSGETRHKHLYTTTTNSVEIQIVKTGEEDGDDPTYFAIVYQAFGCSPPKAPVGGFIETQEGRVVITCEPSNKRWQIICRDGQWHGEYKQCSETIPDHNEGDGDFYFTRDVYMVLVIAIAFVLAVGIVTTGIVCLYRYWNPVPSNGQTRTDYLTHMQMADGNYLNSELSYSLPRHPKGYDTVGYKYHTAGRNDKQDYPYSANVRTGRENDKGYYSDHKYESPVCGAAQVPKSDSVGYQQVKLNEKRTDFDTFPGNNFDTNNDPRAKTTHGILTLPKTSKPDNFDTKHTT